MFVPGRVGDLILLLVFAGMVVILTALASRGKEFKLKRTLAAIEAIPEAIGRAVELGRPVHYTPGGNPLYGVRGTQIQMGLVILGHAARWAAKYNCGLIVSIDYPEQIPIAREIVRGAFAAEGKVTEPDVRYYGTGDAPFGAGCMGTMARERVAASMIIGGSGSDFPIVAEGAFRVGAFQIGGNANLFMIPLVVAACDYVLIGEELFAAGAMLSGERTQLATVVASDISRAIIVAIILMGVILMTAGIPIIKNLLML